MHRRQTGTTGSHWRRSVTVLLLTGLAVAGPTACSGSPERIDPDDPAVVQDREQAGAEATELFSSVVAEAGELTEVGRLEVNRCEAGEDNWKVTDPYHSRCVLHSIAAYAFNGDFTERLDALSTAFAARGWPEVIEDPLRYYTEVGQPVEMLPFGSQTKDEWRIEADPASAASEQSDLESMPGANDRDIGLHVCLDCAYHQDRAGQPWLAAWQSLRTQQEYLIVFMATIIYRQVAR